MKTKNLFIALSTIINFAAKAQFVTIPDTNFVAFLQANYPSCMSGNQMDTTCTNIISATSLLVSSQNISDLTGVKYFTGLDYLYCNNNLLTSLPSLPANLKYLFCYTNQLTSLPSLPANIQTLHCANNQLTNLPGLPANLQILFCGANQLTSLPSLPSTFQELYCEVNQLTSLPSLPPNLLALRCYANQLTSLPSLPANVQAIYCYNNQLTSLPALPANLQYLQCENNLLTSLPALPANLIYLNCYSNQLTSLPSLPANLQSLFCRNNQLTSLPGLPPNLQNLSFRNNLLTSLPPLPANLQLLRCDSNNIACFPIFPISLSSSANFSVLGNPFNCLPNYVSAMDSITLAYPLCGPNNPNACASAAAIAGYTYKDNNINCIKDSGDLTLNNIPLKLYDSNNNLLDQTYSLSNGIYNFAAASGTYTVKIDTAGMPFKVQCAYPGIDSTVLLSNASQLASNVNFDIVCKPGFDIGVQSVVPSGWVFPGQPHTLRIVAGGIGSWYNLNCAAGVSGQVQITVTGPVTYSGSVAGALTPTVSGNIFTYNIVNFDSINIQQAFGLLFTTDTTAQVGDVICVTINVTPVAGDNNPSNNVYQYCYGVINSYDPNMKEVYPVNVLPGFQDWFTYTIHFQNTGTAPAFNIRLTDTLSANFDLETFQVINYSHLNTVTLNDKLLTFRFPNIMLPDSSTNSSGSKGFVQYRIKPKVNLPLGTQIKNTAYIYFDYNTPIITNTTLNEFTTQVTSITSQNAAINNQLYVYPNPGMGNYLVKLLESIEGQISTIEVYNTLGELVWSIKSQNNVTPVNISNQPNGIYFYKIKGNGFLYEGKIIKQD